MSIAADDFLQPWLIDRHPAGTKRPDLCTVFVDADDVVAAFGKTGAGDKADVTGSNNRDFHPFCVSVACDCTLPSCASSSITGPPCGSVPVSASTFTNWRTLIRRLIAKSFSSSRAPGKIGLHEL